MTEPLYTEFPIVYEDEHILLINKPSGILSHPNPLNEKKRLEGQEGRASFLGHYDFDERTFETPKGMIWLLHRLDQEASGILLAAKSPGVAAKLRLMFEKHSLQKIYLVLVGGGRVSPPVGKWQDFMDTRRINRLRRAYVKKNQAPNAMLSYTLVEYLEQAQMSILAIKLVTGKLHQIRVQCASREHPVAGDRLYGDFPWNRMLQKVVGLRRLFLHASSLAFEHPVTGAPLKVEAPLAPELQDVVDQLRRAKSVTPRHKRNQEGVKKYPVNTPAPFSKQRSMRKKSRQKRF